MSQIPLAYATPGFRPHRRPAGVVTMAVISIVWGSLYLLCVPTVLILRFFRWPKPSPGLIAIQQHHHTLFAVITGLDLCDALLAIIMFCAGIAALKLRPWSRRALLSVAVISVALLAISEIVTHHWTIPIERQATPVVKRRPSLISPLYFQIVGPAIALAYSTALLIVFTRPKVKAAFAESTNPVAESPPPVN